MILIHLTVTEAVRQAKNLEDLMYELQTDLAIATGKNLDEIAISGGVSDSMTARYGAMMGIEFLYKVTPENANRVTKTATLALAALLLSSNVVNRTVIGYPTIRDVLPPVIVALS